MNQMDLSEPSKNRDASGADITKMAERELAAFVNAVAELFGAEQAELAARDWLRELNAAGDLPVTAREWWLVTVNAARRAANRPNVPFRGD